MPGLGRKHPQADANAGNRPFPLRFQFAIKENCLIGRCREPTIGLDFRIKLPRPPAGIPQCQQAISRSLAFGNGAQNIDRCGEADIIVNHHRPFPHEVGGMQHKAAPRFHWATVMYPQIPANRRNLNTQLLNQIRKGDGAKQAVDDQPHGPLGIMGAYVNDGAVEPRVGHPRHCHQDLAGQIARLIEQTLETRASHGACLFAGAHPHDPQAGPSPLIGKLRIRQETILRLGMLQVSLRPVAESSPHNTHMIIRTIIGRLRQRISRNAPIGQRCGNPAEDLEATARPVRRIILLIAGLVAAFIGLTGLAAGGAAPLLAADSPWTQAEAAAARLIAATNGVGTAAPLPLGVEITLKPGWKTYWRAPGDAGLPARFDWSGSENLATAEVRWPAPHRFTLFGLETFGYSEQVIFPVSVQPMQMSQPLVVRLGLDILVCSDLCIPQRFDLTLSLPADPYPTTDGDSANQIARFAAQVPGDGVAAGLAITAVRAFDQGDYHGLDIEAVARDGFVAPDVFVETMPPRAFRAPLTQFSDNDRRVRLHLVATDTARDAPPLVGQELVLTLVDGARSLETRGWVIPGGAAPPVTGPGQTVTASATTTAWGAWATWAALLAMLGPALLGGMILNLMPCVLPVLSLKLLSVVQSGGGIPQRVVRANFLASTAGILASFWLLALGLVALKATGAAIGWGIQFQEPGFLIFMLALVTLFAANLWGLFEVPQPRWLTDFATRHGEGSSLAGHFATGALATLLATPCSAPFLGTAVGFALARGGLEIFAIFTTLGLGLALPYLLVALFPVIARHLPRPGRWMLVLRKILAVAMALTGVWLVSVLAALGDPSMAGVVTGLMVLATALLLVRPRLATAPARHILALLAALLLLSAFLVPSLWPQSPTDTTTTTVAPVPEATATGTGIAWHTFAPETIPALVAAGHTVFVDVTADWCITCQANKMLVLSRNPVAERLASIITQRADWTRPDDRITAYLAAHGRYGIPFNIVYGPDAPDGIILPELLDAATVLAALDRAGGTRRFP